MKIGKDSIFIDFAVGLWAILLVMLPLAAIVWLVRFILQTLGLV